METHGRDSDPKLPPLLEKANYLRLKLHFLENILRQLCFCFKFINLQSLAVHFNFIFFSFHSLGDGSEYLFQCKDEVSLWLLRERERES